MSIHMSTQTVIDALEPHIAILDKTGRIVAVNKAWEAFGQQNGLERSLVGTNYLSVLHGKEEYKHVFKAVLDILDGQNSCESVVYPCHAPGVKRWFNMVVAPIQLANHTDGAIVIHYNRTSEKEAEQTLISVMENMTDGFLHVDEEWHFSYMNAAAERMLQINRQDAIGENVWEMFPEAVEDPFYENYYKTMHEKVTTRFESYYEPLDIWFEVTAYPKEDGGISVFFQNITKRRKAEEKIRKYAYQDYLTKLPNRRDIMNEIGARIEDGEPFAVLFMDLDGFKKINDMHGHEKGDQLLQQVGKRLREQMERDHFIGRLGGDEFLILIKGHSCGEDSIQSYANHLLACFERPFYVDGFVSFSIRASVGISCFPEHGTTVSELISTADNAMYEAKTTKGTACVLYREAIVDETKRKRDIGESLNGDLGDAGLSFLVRPQMDMSSGKLYGGEIVPLLDHPEYGRVQSRELFHIAEEGGYVSKIASYLFCELFITMKKWLRDGQFQGKVLFAIQPGFMSSESFFTDWFDLMERFDIPPSLFEIIIKGHTGFMNLNTVIQNTKMCREKGISVSLGNFGTAYAPMTTLKQLPVDQLKIGRDFVWGIGGDDGSEGIIKSIVQLANNLQYTVAAEHVLTEKQANFLKEHGCVVMQGDFVSELLTAAQFEEKYVRGSADGSINSNEGRHN